jgi:hypothetical protein
MDLFFTEKNWIDIFKLTEDAAIVVANMTVKRKRKK